MADEDQEAPPQDAAPTDQQPASEPEPPVPVTLPDFDLELHLRGGEHETEMRTKLVESKDVETKDG